MRPLVSIITPSLNQGRFIEETIRSVLSQDYPNIEYIVIDGGSTDNTINILRKYEGRLLWISEKDHGQSEAINKGIRMSKGEIVAWLNSDDTYLPSAVSSAVSFLEAHPDVMMVYGEGNLIDESNRLIGRFQATEPFNLWRLVNYGDYILQQTVFVRKQVFDEISMLNEKLHYGLDWDLWIRIGEHFKVAYVPEDLANLREHSSAKSSSGGIVRFRELVTIMRQYSGKRFPMAYLRYGWDPYQREIVRKLGRVCPWFGWEWLLKGGSTIRRWLFYLLFQKMTKLAYPSAFPDGWVTDDTYCLVDNPTGGHVLKITVNTANVPLQILPINIILSVSGKTVGHFQISQCRQYELRGIIPPTTRKPKLMEVRLRANRFFSRSFSDTNPAKCRLAYQLVEIHIGHSE